MEITRKDVETHFKMFFSADTTLTEEKYIDWVMHLLKELEELKDMKPVEKAKTPMLDKALNQSGEGADKLIKSGPIDNVTSSFLRASFMVCGLEVSDKDIDLIIDLVEIIERQGKNITFNVLRI